MDRQIQGFYANVEMLERDELFRHLFFGLSRERQKKIEDMNNKAGRAHSLMAWALFDLGLCRIYGLRERDVTISCGAWGKPYVRNHPQIRFNLSHSGDYALAVFAPVEVGCDIQKKERAKSSERIAARFFSQEEQRAVAAGVDFYRIWARKESYLKLSGRGMAYDMRVFSVVEDTVPVPEMPAEAAAVPEAGADDADVNGAAIETEPLDDDAETSAATVSAGQISASDTVLAAGEWCRFADFELPDYCISACYAGAEPLPVTWSRIAAADFFA